MKTLTIFYDRQCGICGRFRVWLEAQPRRVHVEFLPFDSEEALARFPGLPALQADKQVVVLADDGRWWQGSGAWLTCLWTTCNYRDWSYRFASPALQPVVGKIVRLISENRLTLSRLMRLESPAAMAAALTSLPDPGCETRSCSF